MKNALIYFFFLGLSLGAGPCLVTCGPLLISYVAGTRKNIKKSIGAYLLFSLSRISVYLFLGVSVFFLGQFTSKYIFSSFSKLIFICGGLFITVVGVLMAAGRRLDNKICRKIQDFTIAKDAKTILLFGLVVGIVPCLPFMSLLSYIGLVSKSWFDSLIFSFVFGLGTVISPLFILVSLFGLVPKIISQNNKFYRAFDLACGLIIVFLGMQLIVKTVRY